MDAQPSLLTLSRASRGDLYRVVGRSRLSLAIALYALPGIFCVAAGGFCLMGCVRMVLGLEMLGLLWCAFATLGHWYLQSST